MNPGGVQKANSLFERTSATTILLRSFSGCRDPNLAYYAGCPEKQIDGFLVLRKGKKPVLLQGALDEPLPCRSVECVQYSGMNELLRMLSRLFGSRIGINFESYPAQQYLSFKKQFRGKKLVDVSDALASEREVKTRHEQGAIRESVKVAESAFEYFENVFRQGMTERECAQRLSDFFRKQGAEEAFPSIVAFAGNTCFPHHSPTQRKIKGRGVMLVDIGARLKGYCSDITRTYCIGSPKKGEGEAYSLLSEAKRTAQKLIVPGKKASDALKPFAEQYKKAFGSGMVHALGHGIGIEEHDFPKGISEKSDFLFREGMCLAIEPAHYSKKNGFGIRIEDDCVVSAEGCSPLSSAPRDIPLL